MDTPNLIDPVGFSNIKRFLEKQNPSTKQIGGFFGFLSEKNRDSLHIIFIIIFFLLISLFLYYRYKQKKALNKKQKIDEFLNSVSNYLNTS
jgi:hypothetical protein